MQHSIIGTFLSIIGSALHQTAADLIKLLFISTVDTIPPNTADDIQLLFKGTAIHSHTVYCVETLSFDS